VSARRWPAWLLAWPLIAGAAAPEPPGGIANGVNLPVGAPASALDDATAAGFDAVRIFLRWDRIETTEGAPDWTCRYVVDANVAGDADRDGIRELWPGMPCEPGPCGCGASADERVGAAARRGLPIVLTLVGTPPWARGPRAAHCPPDTPGRALPLRADKASAFRTFAAAAARRYGGVAYAFELWNEPDLALCRYWGGTRQQYKTQILGAARAVKDSGAMPGLVVAPTLESPSPDAMDRWMDWSQPVDRASFNLYRTSVSAALATIDAMHAWCASRRGCSGFYVTEFGARRRGAKSCPGPRTGGPGGANAAIMKRCRARRTCAGYFVYALSDTVARRECDHGLTDVRGCRKRRLCTIARRVFGKTALPFACAGCGA
jgi:hypothetical protein